MSLRAWPQGADSKNRAAISDFAVELFQQLHSHRFLVIVNRLTVFHFYSQIMAIDDAIQTLTMIYRSIDRGIPKTIASPDTLVNHLNDLYGDSCEGLTSEELFAYDDVRSPSITLTIGVDVEFDIKKVMENMRTRLHARQYGRPDEIGKTGIVWSHGRYDFMCDDDEGLLRISHRYSHKRGDIKSVLSIIKKMIDYARDYLEEAKKSAGESGGTLEKE